MLVIFFNLFTQGLHGAEIDTALNLVISWEKPLQKDFNKSLVPFHDIFKHDSLYFQVVDITAHISDDGHYPQKQVILCVEGQVGLQHWQGQPEG